MAGTYIEGSSKVLSGVYTLIKAQLEYIAMGARGIVAYPFVSDWGPVNALTPTVYGSEFRLLYNADKTTLSAAKIYKHAFKGKPQQLLAYRMATAAALKGEVILNDAEATPSLVLETLYPSARAFTAVVKDGTTGGKVIEIVEAGVKLLSVEESTIDKLEESLNLSDYVRVKTKGANLPANNAGAAFAGGNNGGPATATEYQAFLDALEADNKANSFSLDGVTDDAIVTLAEEWTKRVRDEGVYITFVNGGPASWDTNAATANAKSTGFNYRGIINVGNGCDGYSAADMAIFIAARAASVALNRTLTDEVLDYKAVNKKLRPGERITAKQSGTLVFVQDGTAVLIDEAVNTLTVPHTDETVEMGKIRVNNALDQIAKDLEVFGDEYKKTRSNTQEARVTYAALVETEYYRGLTTMEVLREEKGYEPTYKPDPDYHGKNPPLVAKIDEAFFVSEIWPVDSMEKIYQKINLHF